MDYFDLHCDTLLKLNKKQTDLAVTQNNGFEKYCQVFSLFIEEDDANPKKTYEELMCTAKEYPFIKLLSLENALPLGKDLSMVNSMAKDGIKSIMLTWNSNNIYAGGAHSNGDLTSLGKELILEMNKNNIALDVSHLNEKSFYSAIKYADIVLASHSNCKCILNHNRNLSDDQIKAIISKNGVIGLNFYPEFLGENVFLKIYQNIIHIINLGGEYNICLGSDFDGAIMDKRLDNILKVKDLYKFLKLKNLSENLLNRVFYSNAERFYSEF